MDAETTYIIPCSKLNAKLVEAKLLQQPLRQLQARAEKAEAERDRYRKALERIAKGEAEYGCGCPEIAQEALSK